MIDSHLQTRKLPNQQQQPNALRKLFVVALEDVNDLATRLSYKTIVVLGNAKFLTKFIDRLPNYHHISIACAYLNVIFGYIFKKTETKASVFLVFFLHISQLSRLFSFYLNCGPEVSVTSS